MELQDVYERMKDSSAFNCKDQTPDGLIAHGDEFYELYLVIHIVNGECITLRNHSADSWYIDCYAGDNISIERNNISLEWWDDEGRQHFTIIPFDAICWIDSYSAKIDWNVLKIGN